ncbi:hypothetical protein NESM_000241800 [Novymonas esmeraldas]|uniref:Uncharacterized protein n=1 Tax=Novymonas esmeraldas TaxID=1808958 RepID=A0AAW0F641_9TRYP
MEFERGPARCAPGIPVSSTDNCDVCSRSSSPPQHCGSSLDRLLSTDSDGVSQRALRSRQDALDRRESNLRHSERLFCDRVAAWEARCRQWEAAFAARLADLDAREVLLGRDVR